MEIIAALTQNVTRTTMFAYCSLPAMPTSIPANVSA